MRAFIIPSYQLPFVRCIRSSYSREVYTATSEAYAVTSEVYTVIISRYNKSEIVRYNTTSS